MAMKAAVSIALSVVLAGAGGGASLSANADSLAPTRPPASQALARPGALRLAGADQSRVPIVRGSPLAQFYPSEAKLRRIAGLVEVDLLIDESGHVVEAKVLSETPPRQGFGAAALEAVKSFEFDNPLKSLVLMSKKVKFAPTD
jgi:TonB family protein